MKLSTHRLLFYASSRRPPPDHLQKPPDTMTPTLNDPPDEYPDHLQTYPHLKPFSPRPWHHQSYWTAMSEMERVYENRIQIEHERAEREALSDNETEFSDAPQEPMSPPPTPPQLKKKWKERRNDKEPQNSTIRNPIGVTTATISGIAKSRRARSRTFRRPKTRSVPYQYVELSLQRGKVNAPALKLWDIGMQAFWSTSVCRLMVACHLASYC